MSSPKGHMVATYGLLVITGIVALSSYLFTLADNIYLRYVIIIVPAMLLLGFPIYYFFKDLKKGRWKQYALLLLVMLMIMFRTISLYQSKPMSFYCQNISKWFFMPSCEKLPKPVIAPAGNN